MGSPSRAERETFGVIMDKVWPIQGAFVAGEPLCDREIPSWALIIYFGTVNEKRVVGYRRNICKVPSQSGTRYFWGDLRHFRPIQAGFVVGEPLSDLGTPF